MQMSRQPSWRLVTDAPEELNFAMYVACSFDLLKDHPPFSRDQMWSAYRHESLNATEHEELAGQWLQWWGELVIERANRVDDGRQRMWRPPFPLNDRLQTLEVPLRTRCQEAIESFRGWWGHAAGGQQGVNYWAERVEFRPLINQVEQEIGRTVRPFGLTVEFVYTGLANIVEVHSTYAVMSVDRPNVSVYDRKWWLAKVRELA